MRFPLAAAALTASALLAQGAEGYDPMRSASGWARMDKDGSITFYDAATQSLRTWSRDVGEMGSVSLARLEGAPEKWVIDIYGNAWVVASDGTLNLVEAKTGKVGAKERLPGDVCDLAWDVKGLVLAFRGAEPYLEKRDYRAGRVLWSYGAKPKRGGPATTYRIAVTDDGQVLLAGGVSLPLTVVDGGKGKVIGQTAFSFNGIAAPDLILGDSERGPLVTWTGKNLAYASVTGRQVPEAKMNGALLARLDLSQSALEFLPTGLAEGHVLVGIHDSTAFFAKPGGGLATVAVR